jgi:hypothetical protein
MPVYPATQAVQPSCVVRPEANLPGDEPAEPSGAGDATSWRARLGRIALLALLYVATGGLELAHHDNHATHFWPPAG